MKIKKNILSKFMTVTLAAAVLAAMSGCGKNAEDGQTTISVGLWPNETQEEALKIQNQLKDDFMAENQDINIIPDTYQYDTKTFMMKASANQLPNLYSTFFTEISQIVKQGYAADITKYMDEHHFTENLNQDLLKAVTGEDGKIYGIPYSGYIQGLYINKALYREAGLVNADGSIKVPDTWQELAEYSQIVKEKTGKAGYCIPTINNAGGWHFMNIAWSYGVEFEKQNADGKWEATFNTQEARDALQFVKDLKWKYNALVDDTAIGQDDMYKYFGSGQAATMIQNPPFSGFSWGLDNSELMLVKIPQGPKGRIAQMGGNIWVFSPNSTPDQIEAGFKWLEYGGLAPEMTEKQEETYRKNCQQTAETYVLIQREGMEVWKNPETVDKMRKIREEYANVDYNDYKSYFDADDVTVHIEPEACAQQLYSILDKCIQEVITNENADVATLISDACNDFQVNHLDKMGTE